MENQPRQINDREMIQNQMMEQLASDMKTTGTLYLVFGIITCLGFITAIFGIPMILAGLKAQEGSDKLRYYLNGSENEGDIYAFYSKLQEHFKMTKIYFFIYIGFIILSFALYALFFGVMFSTIINSQM